MAKEPAVVQAPSFPRFILWEILGIMGLLHILLYAPPNDKTPLFFLANSAVFAILYPVLYFYNQFKIPPVIKFLILPLSITLRIILMVSSYVWVTYVMYATGFYLGEASCFVLFKNYWMFLAPFYVVDYFLFFEHLWGLSRVNFTFWSSAGMISDLVSGSVLGYKLGQIFISKWGGTISESVETQSLIWFIFILMCVAVVVWFDNKTRKG